MDLEKRMKPYNHIAEAKGQEVDRVTITRQLAGNTKEPSSSEHFLS